MEQPVTTAEIHKELDLIQDVIKRMAENSFKVKSWFLGAMSAVAVFGEKGFITDGAKLDPWVSLLLSLFVFAIVLAFWYLDAFFLKTEKIYRKMYHWAVQNRPATSAYLYDLNTMVRKNADGTESNFLAVDSIPLIMFSKTLLPLYGLLFALSIGLLAQAFGTFLET